MSDNNKKPLCVTLERAVNIPGSCSEPPQTKVLRARERSVGDETTTFFGLNIGPEHTTVEIKNENIRSVAHLGPIDYESV